MRDSVEKLEEMILENKMLYEKLKKLQNEFDMFENQIYKLEKDKTYLAEEVSKLKKEIVMLKKEAQASETVKKEREKVLKNEINRMEIFKNKLKGSKKNEQLVEIKTEFNCIFKRNSILMGIVYELVRVVGGDFEVLNNLLEISDETDNSVLESYLETLKQIYYKD